MITGRLTLRSSNSDLLGDEEAKMTRLSFKNLKMGKFKACSRTGDGLEGIVNAERLLMAGSLEFRLDRRGCTMFGFPEC